MQYSSTVQPDQLPVLPPSFFPAEKALSYYIAFTTTAN